MNKRKDNFIRLAEARTNKILKSLELLGNLSNKSYYDYSAQQITTIFNAIEDELETQKQRFNKNDKKGKRFRL